MARAQREVQRDVARQDAPGTEARRLQSEDRRATLMRAAVELLVQDGIGAVSMEAVATRAGVSRPLVYKHFANRDELLAEAYRQEAARLDAAIVAAVERVNGFEPKLRAVVRAALDAETTYGPLFRSLARAGVRDRELCRDQSARNQRTVAYFAELAAAEFDIGMAEATTAAAVLLSGIETILAQWRANPRADSRRFLESVYVDLVIGAFAGLATPR